MADNIVVDLIHLTENPWNRDEPPSPIKQIILPFSYQDFKTLFNAAVKANDTPDFTEKNWDNLRNNVLPSLKAIP